MSQSLRHIFHALLAILAWNSNSVADELDPARSAMHAGQLETATTLLRQQLGINSAFAEARFLLARTLSWQGKYAEASAEYAILLKTEPDNTDYMLGLAQTHVWSKRPLDALPLLQRARALSPQYADLWRLNIQALAAAGEAAFHARALALQQEAQNRFPQEDWQIVVSEEKTLQPAMEGLPVIATTKPTPDALDRKFEKTRNSQVAAGFSYENLDKGNSAWHSMFVDFEHIIAPRQIVYGSVRQVERFDLKDEELQAGFYFPVAPLWTLNMEGNWSPSHRVLAQRSGMLSLQRELAANWYITGGLRQTEYNKVSATQGSLLLERYSGDYRLAYTLAPTHAADSITYNHRFQLSRYYNEISSVSLTASAGEEVDRDQGQRLFYDTWFIGANGRHWLNRDWALNWDIGHTRQGSAYSKDEVRLGVRRAF